MYTPSSIVSTLAVAVETSSFQYGRAFESQDVRHYCKSWLEGASLRYKTYHPIVLYIYLSMFEMKFLGMIYIGTGFIRVRQMSGKFKFFQGQEIVREFYVVSVKNKYLLKCQGNVREFYHFKFVSNDKKQKIPRAVVLTFWKQALSFL